MRHGFPADASVQKGWAWNESSVSFQGSNGWQPLGNVILDESKHALYGTTYYGGAYGYGTVFQIVAWYVKQEVRLEWRETGAYSNRSDKSAAPLRQQGWQLESGRADTEGLATV